MLVFVVNDFARKLGNNVTEPDITPTHTPRQPQIRARQGLI